jgi:hypothetical protein
MTTDIVALCALCERREQHHLGPKKYCTVLGQNTFATQKDLIKLSTAAKVLAGALGGARLIGKMVRGEPPQVGEATFDELEKMATETLRGADYIDR